MTKSIISRLSAIAALASGLWAQVPAPGNGVQDYPFQIAYATALSTGDAVINITNTGAFGASLSSSGAAAPALPGTICVNAYAFSPDEQLISCCTCAITPNGLRSLSVRRDLTNNTLTPAVPTSVVVKLVASVPVSNSCTNQASVLNTNPAANSVATTASAVDAANLPMGMRAWMATTHGTSLTGTAQVTEFPFVPSTLSAGETTRLKALCGFNQANGSGFGVCTSCTLGGLGASRN